MNMLVFSVKFIEVRYPHYCILFLYHLELIIGTNMLVFLVQKLLLVLVCIRLSTPPLNSHYIKCNNIDDIWIPWYPFSPFSLTVDGGRGTPKSIGQKRTPVKRSPAKTLSPLAQKLNELYNAIKNYTDQHGRELSPPFIRLPSKNVSNINNV